MKCTLTRVHAFAENVAACTKCVKCAKQASLDMFAGSKINSCPSRTRSDLDSEISCRFRVGFSKFFRRLIGCLSRPRVSLIKAHNETDDAQKEYPLVRVSSKERRNVIVRERERER